jgi:two-component system nitrate/nitrite response regulator NarP
MYIVGVVRALRGREGIVVTATGTTSEEAVQFAAEHYAEVVLFDIGLPGGIAAVNEIKHIGHPVKIILLSNSESEVLANSFQLFQAHGCMLRSITEPDLVSAICEVESGSLFVSPELTSRVAVADGHLVERDSYRLVTLKLTYLEVEILQHVSSGLHNKEVAELVGLTESAIRNRLSSIMRKLNVRSRSEAAALYSGVHRRH